MATKQSSASDKIMLEKLRLMSKHPFFASILLHFKFHEVKEDDEDYQTLAVDAFGNVIYNPKFINKLTDIQLRFVLLHELMHVVLRHTYRIPDKTILKNKSLKSIWNFAVDLVANDILANKETLFQDNSGNFIVENFEDTFLIPNKEGIYSFTFFCGEENDLKEIKFSLAIRDKTAEAIYYEILKNLPSRNVEKKSLSGSPLSDYRTIGKGFDKHNYGKNKQDKNSESDNGSNNNSSKNNKEEKDTDNGSNSKNPLGEENSNELENKDNSSSGNNQLETQELSEDEMENLDRKWSGVVASASMQRTCDPKGNSWVSRILEEFARPQLNWRSLLRRHIKETIPYDSSYKKPRRRSYSTGVYYPITYYKPHILTVAVDISGSISDTDLKTFITEVYGITRSYNNVDIRVLFWSTKVDSKTDRKYKPNHIKEILSVKAYTTGGTYISCVEDYIKDNDCKETSIIYLTDGFVENKPEFVCKNKKRIFIIQAQGDDTILKDYGLTAKLKY